METEKAVNDEDDVFSLSDLANVLGVGDDVSALPPTETWLVPAKEEDFRFEFLDLECAVKTVETFDEAVEYINTHNTKHS